MPRRSQQRTAQAQRDGILAQEIVPVQIVGRKGAVSDVREDEHPRPETTLEQLAKLKAPFRRGGVITAGNASGVNDGAAALIIASEQQAAIEGLTPRARIVAMATAGVEPRLMGLGPVPAVRKVLERAGLNINDMDLIELNEASPPVRWGAQTARRAGRCGARESQRRRHRVRPSAGHERRAVSAERQP